MSNITDRISTGNQNTHFMFNNFFSRKLCCLWDNVGRYYRAGQATDDNIIRRMRTACWIIKATNTYSEYVILIVFNEPPCYVIRTLPVFYSNSENPRGFFPPQQRKSFFTVSESIPVLYYLTHVSSNQQRLIGDINKVKLHGARMFLRNYYVLSWSRNSPNFIEYKCLLPH